MEADRAVMKRTFAGPFPGGAPAVMKQVGYQYHCGQDGRPCYHRQLNDPKFPRFHAYTIEYPNGSVEIDLHFDALDPIEHRGNHDQAWAYGGGRVMLEMERMTHIINGHDPRAAGTQLLPRKQWTKRVPKNLIDLLFG